MMEAVWQTGSDWGLGVEGGGWRQVLWSRCGGGLVIEGSGGGGLMEGVCLRRYHREHVAEYMEHRGFVGGVNNVNLQEAPVQRPPHSQWCR